MLPPRRRTPATVSVPAEKERARNWEERKQQRNWAQSRPTHGSETSPNRTHNNTQGNHEVRALQQPPNAARGRTAHLGLTHTENTARQAMDGLWTEACGQQKQSNDPANNQHILNTPTIGRR